ncbi:MAG: hypothetical protein FWG42_04315 [Clostridiales bacterium]|nr:hypothetical protein [Clostridiales bacterium]
MAATTSGNCYICGTQLGKTAMKNHILKVHDDPEGDQQCLLLKVEGAYNKDYWLYIDVPVDKTLTAVDTFLRKIWLECCGHLSAFRYDRYTEVGKSRKLGTLSIGAKLNHEYDFGTTTETIITVVAVVKRRKQRELVRLLARNVPLEFECANCGKTAEYICCQCIYDVDNPFYCGDCAEEHEKEHDFMLPVTNSPRMGECGYDGELDVYEFDLQKVVAK